MATVSFDKTGPGAGGFSQLLGSGPRKIISGTFAFDSSYTTGGEDITDITSRFRDCQGVIFETDGTRLYRANVSTKKVLAYSALGTEVANATNLSAATGVRWIAWGL